MRIAVLIIAAVFYLSALPAAASPAKIVSGELFIGGSAYGTIGYQTYLRYQMTAKRVAPQRVFLLDAEQNPSGFQNFPSRPEGAFDFSLLMPHHPQRLLINDELFSPVWYYESIWTFSSNIVTPEATPTSPNSIHIQAPFEMAGFTSFFGAYRTGFKTVGHGTLDVLLERDNSKYFVREARFLFGTSAPASNP